MIRIRWKDFELPTRVVLDEKTSTRNYGKFIIEPFEQGFGVTIGNSLRRILYSSIEGTAVTSVKIKGAPHEFTSLDGVQEDVVDIILNLKQLVFRLHGDITAKTLQLKASKKGEIRAEHIAPEMGVEIVNPEAHIATLAEDVEFDCKIEIKKGRRYVTAEELQKDLAEIDGIPVDANFSPVKRVKYSVENTRVGRFTNYDRLIFEVWTTGAVTPEEALVESAKILRKHLNPFVQQYNLGRPVHASETKVEEIKQKKKKAEELRNILSVSMSELDLSMRAYNSLVSEKIETIGDLVIKTEPELLKLKNFGKTSLREVKKKLAERGLSLGINIEELLGRKE